MREEALNWLKQARANFNAANSNYRTGVYFVAAFLSQQCAGAALKAVCLVKRRKQASMHNLLDLGGLRACPSPSTMTWRS